MKAIVISEHGDAGVLRLQDVEAPVPGPRDLLVRVHATAVNRADVLQRRGGYPAPDGVRSDIPGLEFAGEVEQTGSEVSSFRSGDRVMGLLPGEGYAEKIVTPEVLALPVPAKLSWEEAAAIPEVFLTAYDALCLQLQLSPQETVLIHAAASGVGTAAIQLAKARQAITFGTSSSDEKLEACGRLGLDFAVNYQKEDFAERVLTLTRQRGVDVVLDLVGASHLQKNLQCLALKGRMIVVGLVGGSRAEIDLGVLLRKRLRLLGTVLRARTLEEKAGLTKSFKDEILPLFESGRLRPVLDRVFPLQDAASAHQHMESNRNIGKIVLKVS